MSSLIWILGLVFLCLQSTLSEFIASQNLQVEIPGQVVIGRKYVAYCELPEEQILDYCQIITNKGDIWKVENGTLSPDGGDPVPPQYEAYLGNSSNVCGLTFLAIEKYDLGNELV